MGTQTAIAKQIIISGADYILSLKGNQKHLFEDVKDSFTGKYHSLRYETLEKAHGRIEKRIYTTLNAREVFDEERYREWEGLSSLIQVERIVGTLDGDSRSEKQYYISGLSYDTCEQIGSFIRGHWAIENRLHWHLDVTFREDHCRARKDHSRRTLRS